jgi:PST family polysaccharide transporter
LNLIKTSLLSGIATITKIISAFIVNKVVAVYTGPSGLVIVAQFQNFVSLVLNFSGNSLSTATTKYTAEHRDDVNQKHKLWSAVVKITFPISFLFSLFIFFYARKLSVYFFYNSNFEYIFKIFAVTLPFFLVNTLFMSILNGRRSVKKYILLNVSSSVVSLVFISSLTVYWQLDGALLATILGQFAILIVTIFSLKNEPWLKVKNFTQSFDFREVKKLFSFAIITFTSVSSSAIVLIVLRDYLTQNFSVESAGYWQAVWNVSQVTLSLVSTSLATYYLPTLAVTNDVKKIAHELKQGYLIMMPVSIIIALFSCIFKQQIILILFSKSFMPMESLFFWQFIGGVIKVSAWLIGYLVVAKAMVKVVVITEVLFALSFVMLTKFFTDMFGLVGITHAYALNSALQLFFMMYVYHFRIKKGKFNE